MDGPAEVTRLGDSGSWDARSQRRQSRRYYAVSSKANGASKAVLSVCLSVFACSQMDKLFPQQNHEDPNATRALSSSPAVKMTD